ncbi:hypothetical protein CR513_42950, partial [Mucuna pruriens]
MLKHKFEAPKFIKSFFAYVKTYFDKPMKSREAQNTNSHVHIDPSIIHLWKGSIKICSGRGECLTIATFLINWVSSSALQFASSYELLYKKQSNNSTLEYLVVYAMLQQFSNLDQNSLHLQLLWGIQATKAKLMMFWPKLSQRCPGHGRVKDVVVEAELKMLWLKLS